MACIAVSASFVFFTASLARAADVMVPVSRSELIEVPVEMGEVIVADPDVADVYVHGKSKLSIIGKSLGQTTVRMFDKDSKLIRKVNVVVGYDLPAIRKSLKDLLPYENIGVEMVNTNLALTGQISSSSAADQAVKIANEFVEPAFDKKGGSDSSYNKSKPVSKVLNLLTISSGQQVMLRVRVGEIKRDAVRNLGLNLQAIKQGADSAFAIGTGGGVTAFTAGSDLVFGQHTIHDGSSLFAGGTLLNSSGNGLSAAIDALESNGLFKVLAEPNLVAISGEEAQFLAGGEFPIPVDNGNDGISIEFKPFGVSVKFLPVVLSESRIRILVEPEVSELSNADSVQIGTSFFIPSISTRRARTTVELAPGESFMIAGLIQDRMQTDIKQIPGLSEIPIFSALLRSTEFERHETELVLAVTPYLVDPQVSSDVKLPTDEFRPATFMENIFYGALGSLSNDAEHVSQTPALEGPIGFMVD